MTDKAKDHGYAFAYHGLLMQYGAKKAIFKRIITMTHRP